MLNVDNARLHYGAAEALRGPVCILAGAGTGKTRAITHRIAHGVATGTYAPNRVLALTFTSRAAAELRSRLRALGAGGVPAVRELAASLAAGTLDDGPADAAPATAPSSTASSSPQKDASA